MKFLTTYFLSYFRFLLTWLENIRIQLNIILINHTWLNPLMSLLILGIFNFGTLTFNNGTFNQEVAHCTYEYNNYIPEVFSKMAGWIAPSEIEEPINLEEPRIYIPVITEVLEWSAGMLINEPIEATIDTDSDTELSGYDSTDEVTKEFLEKISRCEKSHIPYHYVDYFYTKINVVVDSTEQGIYMTPAELKNIIYHILKDDPLKEFWITDNKEIFLNHENLPRLLRTTLADLIQNRKQDPDLTYEREVFIHLITQSTILNLAAITNHPVEFFVDHPTFYTQLFDCYTKHPLTVANGNTMIKDLISDPKN